MKSHLLILLTLTLLSPSTVSAFSFFNLFESIMDRFFAPADFSIGTVKKHIKTLPQNAVLLKSYDKNKPQGCDSLDSEPLTLQSAAGEHWDGPNVWKVPNARGRTSSTKQLNMVSYIYYVKGGSCGVIIARKELLTDPDTNEQELKWSDPVYFADDRAWKYVYKRGIKVEELEVDAADAGAKVQDRTFTFQKVILAMGETQPVYVFHDHARIKYRVFVGATDGKADNCLGYCEVGTDGIVTPKLQVAS